MSRKPTRITGQRPDECGTCEGLGETKATCREMRQAAKAGKLFTHRLGSGCPDCYGTGKRIIRGVVVAAFGTHGMIPAKQFDGADAEQRAMAYLNRVRV